jgi:preprotein translocase subunit SecG
MINLLPPETKKQLYAARSNTLLARYNFALLLSVLFLVVAIGLTYLYLSNTKSSNEEVIRANTAEEGNYTKVKAEAKTFKENLTADKQVLDQSFDYTTLVMKITQLIPSGVVLNNLTLDTKSFGTETSFIFKAKNYASAIALKDSFQNSSLFSNVHFASISGSEDKQYPVDVTLNVTIKKEAAL